MPELDDMDALERELGVLFDETAFEPNLSRLHQTARTAAQIPDEVSLTWWSWFRSPSLPLVTGALLMMVWGSVELMSLVEPDPDVYAHAGHASSLFSDEATLHDDDWEALELLSAGDLGLELLDLPDVDVDPLVWEETSGGLLEEI